MTASGYPVRLQARLDDHLSRWRWLVKWFLAIPHYVVLAFLWVAFVVLSAVAFFAILFTGRYPRAVFDFNVGVLRWTWRVNYYSCGALGTDHYPPFTLKDVPEYPTHLDVAYPDHLSRGLVLVKWWLLALPHYLIVGLFAGSGWLAWRDNGRLGWLPGGLIGILVLVAAVALLFTGRYPRQLFDFVLGLNRWVLRVAAYAALMTDSYPPFRLDLGGEEPGTTLAIPAAPVSLEKPAEPVAAPAPVARPGWTGWRVTGVVVGSLVTLLGLGLAAAGGVGVWFDHHRDGGYVTSSTESRHVDGYAITSERITLDRGPLDWAWERHLIGRVRIRVTGETATPVFVGIARADAAEQYLAGVPRLVLRDAGGDTDRTIAGTLTPTRPGAKDIWVARASGTGELKMLWNARPGDWAVVIMNVDGSRGVAIRGDVGATIPALAEIAAALFVGAAIAFAIAVPLLIVPIRRASRRAPADPA